MSKVNVSAIAEDERNNNVKKSAARRSASDAQAAAQKMEGKAEKAKNLFGEIRKNVEEAAQAAIVPDFAAYVIKYTFAELKKEYRKCYVPIEDGDNTEGQTLANGGIRKFYEKKGRGCKYFRYYRLNDEARLKVIRTFVSRLRTGYTSPVTERFTQIPSTREVEKGVREFFTKPVTTLHEAFSAMVQSYLIVDEERKKAKAAEEERKKEQAAKLAAMTAKVQDVLAKIQNNTATPEEMAACILAQAEIMKLQK